MLVMETLQEKTEQSYGKVKHGLPRWIIGLYG